MGLCFTGKRRLSAGIIDDQVGEYTKKKKEVVEALDKTKKLAIEMKNNLLTGRIDEFGILLNEAWIAKRHFSSKITDSDIDRLYDIGINNGAIGGKLLGAGGGGYLLFLCEYDKWHEVAHSLEQGGGEIMNFAFDHNGLQIWESNIQLLR